MDRIRNTAPLSLLPFAGFNVVSFVCQLLKLTGLDSQWLVVLSPKLLQAVFTALGETALSTAVR